jgi:hypothetical protein
MHNDTNKTYQMLQPTYAKYSSQILLFFSHTFLRPTTLFLYTL